MSEHDGTSAQAKESAKAAELKQDSAPAPHPDAGRQAGQGMTPTPNEDIAPSGALDAEGYKPVVERSRKAR